MPSSQPAHTSATRPLDTIGMLVVVFLCFSWGFNQVSIKLAIHDIPPLTQAVVRSVVASVIVWAWMWFRGMPLFGRDGTLRAGVVCGLCFGAEFVMLYQGLNYTTASRATLFLYLAPFFVVLGVRWLVPADRFGPWQWLGLGLSFVGMAVAFGAPSPAADPRQMLGDILVVGAAFFWAMTTLLIKGTRLGRASSEKVIMYQLGISVPILATAALSAGEHLIVNPSPSALAIGALAYQAVYVVPVTFVVWFAMIVRYSASRLSAFTFLSPLCGAVAGHLILGDPLNAGFVTAVVLVMAGLILVNRAR